MASKKRSKAALRRAALKGWRTRRRKQRQLKQRKAAKAKSSRFSRLKRAAGKVRRAAEGERPQPDYMQEIADQFDIDISDLYDMYYGYYED